MTRGHVARPLPMPESASRERDRRLWVLARVVLFAAAALIAAQSAWTFISRATSSAALSPYLAPTYWLDYDRGFMRRAFTGEVLTWLTFDDVPSLGAAKGWSVALTAATVAAILWLAWSLSKRVAGGPMERLAVAAAVIASPLLLSLSARDFGRPDAFGIVAVVVVALTPWRRVPLFGAIGAMAALAAAATAAEEFLLLLVGPLVLLQAWQRLAAEGRRPTWAATAVVPAGLLAIASVLVPPPAETLRSAVSEAAAAGAPRAQPLVADGVTLIPENHSVVPLSAGLAENARNYYADISPLAVIVMTLVWALAFLATIALVWWLLGGSLREPAFIGVAGCGVLVALALSVLAIDHRRWWALAAVAAVAALFAMARPREPRTGPAVAAAAVMVAGSGVLFQTFYVYTTELSWSMLPLL